MGFYPLNPGEGSWNHEPHSIAQHAPVTKFDIENPSAEELWHFHPRTPEILLNNVDFSYAQSLAAGIAGEVF